MAEHSYCGVVSSGGAARQAISSHCRGRNTMESNFCLAPPVQPGGQHSQSEQISKYRERLQALGFCSAAAGSYSPLPACLAAQHVAAPPPHCLLSIDTAITAPLAMLFNQSHSWIVYNTISEWLGADNPAVLVTSNQL